MNNSWRYFDALCRRLYDIASLNDALNQLQKTLSKLTNFIAKNHSKLSASKSELKTFCQKKNDKKIVETDRLIINDQY